MPEFNVEDFSGGETDKFRNNNDPRFCQEAKNLYITEQRTLISRPGLQPYSLTQRPFDPQAVTKIWHHTTRNPQGGTTGSPGGDTFSTRYQTFISSNSAVRVNENTDTDPEIVTTPEGNNHLYFDNLTTQGNYIRLNDNEFVVIPKNQGAFSRHPQKFYRFGVGSSGWRYVALGLPRYTGNGFRADISQGQVGPNNWTYAMVLKHEYVLYEAGAGFVTKIVRGAPNFSDLLEGVDIAEVDVPSFTDPISLSWVDSDGAGVGFVNNNDFDYSNIKIELYRTKSNGSVFYKLFEFTSAGTTNWLDSTTDDDLESGELLYTTGGVLSNDMTTDRVQFGTFANDCLWLFSSSRGWQSKIGIYDAHPGSFNFKVREGEQITGCNTIDIYPIVGTRQGIYRIEGIVDDIGSGLHQVRTISEEHGCMSNRTMVRAKNKIFFWSDDGIYETNGYQARKVSNLYDDRYREIVNRVGSANTVDVDAVFLADGAYDVENERIMWIFPANDGDTYSTRFIVMHLSFPHEEGYAITSGELSHDAISISAAGGSFFITTEDGSVLQEDPDSNEDAPKSGLSAQPIIWQYTSCIWSFGTRRLAKWCTRLFFTFKPQAGTALNVDVQEDTNESGDFRDLNPINESVKTDGNYILKRWFKRNRIRGIYKQIRLKQKSNVSNKTELVDMMVEYSAPGEGVTESDRT